MKTKWCLFAAVVSLVLPFVAEAGSCTAGRFHFINNHGCDDRNGGAGGVPKAKCPDCPGMPVWWVPEPYVNLEMADEPLSYVMSSGKEMSFKWYYDQHFEMPKADEIPNWYYYLGSVPYSRVDYFGLARTGGMTNAAWAHNWMMNITFWDAGWEKDWHGTTPPGYPVYSHGYEAVVFRPEGGLSYFYSTNGGSYLQDAESQLQLVPLSSDPRTATPSGTNNIYWGDAGNGFKLVYPDGGQEVFNLTMTNNFVGAPPVGNGSSSAAALLTQRIDPQGRVTKIGYEFAVNTNSDSSRALSGFRVKYVVDPDGRTNTFVYAANSLFVLAPVWNPWMLSEVDDPYGRKTSFQYTLLLNQTTDVAHAYNYGMLTGITDAAGLTSYFQYQASPVNYTLYYKSNGYTMPTNVVGLAAGNGWITNLSTPYGNTRFSYFEVPDTDPDTYQKRAIYVSEPEGAQQLYYYIHYADSLMATTAAKPTVPGHTDFDDGNAGLAHYTLNYRNTVYWGRRQCAALSSTVLASLPSNLGNALTNLMTASDFKKGRLRNWLWQPDNVSISDALASEREPSQDSAGAIEDTLRLWYNYAGKTTPEVIGSDPRVTCIARLLPDSGSQYTIYNYHPPGSPGAGLASDNESTYSQPDGSPGTLTNWFGYSTNNIDLLSVSNSAGQFVHYGYTNHSLASLTNALNQVTTFSWETTVTHNLEGIQFPGGATIALAYYLPAYGRFPFTNATSSLLKQISFQPEGRVFNIIPANGLPGVVTDDRGLTVVNTWDGLNRLTGTVFPDGTSISNIYSRLDLVASKDRLGHWTYYSFDGLQHLTAVTNANNAVTTYTYCGCGSLESVLDALNNLTTLSYDNQGNLTGVTYPDASSVTYEFDLAGRMTQAADGAGRYLQVGYNLQGLPLTITGANGSLRTATYDAVNRPIRVTDANGVTVTNQFDAINELVKRTWPGSGGGAPAAETFGYNAAGLAAYTNRDHQVTRYGRDGAGRLLAVTNANLEVTQFTWDSQDNVLSLVDGLNHTRTWQYNEYGWLTNKTDGLTRNVFRYAYNANGWLTNRWTPEKGNTGYAFDNVGNRLSINYPLLTITYAYNLLNELTNMVDAVGNHAFGWTVNGQLQSESDAWATVGYSYAQGLRTGMSVGAWSQSYGYDAGWRMTGLTSPAGSFGYVFGGASAASSLIQQISLPNGASITNTYDSLARLTGTALNNYWGHTLDGYSYQYDALGLRTNLTRNFGLTSSSVDVGYDNIQQITSWSASELDGTPRLNEQQGWAYDAAHNLHTRTNNLLVQTFTTDAADQLNSVTRSGTFTLSGATPAPAASVTVNGSAAQTYGDFTFARTNLTLANGSNPFTNIAQNTYGLTVTNTLTVNLPQSVSFGFDSNGNLTNDGTKTFAYDAENQLTNVTVANSFKKDFVYDGLNRLRIKREYGWTGSAWTLTNEIHLVWDGNVIVQLRDSNNVPTLTLTRGLDLSGSLQGAGGIGGLLAMTDGGGANYYYHQDGIGNITSLMDAQENIVARRIYDGFGRTISLSGGKSGLNPFWASSQLHDETLDMDSYLYRNLFRGIQRWGSQDPAGLAGGTNPYGFTRNNPLRFIDPDGKAPQVVGVSYDLNGGNSGALYQDQQFGQGYGIGLHTPEGSPLDMLNAYNDWQDEQNQNSAQQIADWLGKGNDPQTVSDIYDQLTMISMMGVPEGELGGLTKFVKCPSWKSVRQFGHTFSEHGAGRPLQQLIDRAGSLGPQGQWLSNEKAAQFLSEFENKLSGPASVRLPPGLGQIINADGTVVGATRATIVPKAGGGFRTAYPIP